ncbi:ubiquinol-cytochrome c reductase iron-sulfur subunit [Methyloceanibacter sp.]|uniref:ubiquinol-cytochrome c reductase iron-sulfur subunit n=1 Tax=Methyloceanibacter sp. TaxID=1965321 RepID=UPI002C9BED68|nr:ubiquinol-cytochrome c reductase iron-sulfur subunit [Methyloceanibacter sp.]HML92745.1 ubiquinol-cytochrome c reductase iron-sulfur subunit [Methyloceanibacter sp.]
MANSDSSTNPSLAYDDDPSRRDVILIGAGAFAAIGGAVALWPLIDQMNPDASTLSLASIDVDLAPIDEGQAITVMWRGKPIFIRHRTAKEVEEAKDVKLDDLVDPLARNANLPDDAPATDANRAAADKEPWLVMIGICTHLGCIPKGQAIGDYKGEYGGWFCPCHGSQYDTSGRIRKGPAPENMYIPPYAFTSDTKIKIG